MSSATVELDPLMVFIGPNNSGKSIVATVMYAALSRMAIGATARFHNAFRTAYQDIEDDLLFDAEIFLAEAVAKKHKPEFDELPEYIRNIYQESVRLALVEYADTLVEELERVTGTPVNNLRRVQKKSTKASIEIISAHPAWTIHIAISGKSPLVHYKAPLLREVWQLLTHQDWSRIRRRPARARRSFLRDLGVELNRVCFREVPVHSKYLPAARSGLMQSHKVIAGSLLRNSSLAGLRNIQIPTLTGVVTDFLSEVLELEPGVQDSRGFEKEARVLEKEVLQGEIFLTSDAAGNSEILYQTTAGAFPVGRTSSMVSELAPVVLYLRHVLRKGDLLIFEEPEAHLHPATQIVLARNVAKLVNQGLLVALTTHSEFFLQQLNNAIVASSMSEQRAMETGIDPDVRLKASRVSAYLFEPSVAGTVVTRLPVDPLEGIPESSFGLIAEQLYNQNVDLERQLNAAT
ncbi:AAA family ATPase [Streptosporangium sp. NPDC023963]|uniref:AAA family ATPase n=1 Tax=Streptosporangium sp. NPDC023963 TaxID=3155608 RepID=UPI00341BB9DC